MKFLNKLMIYCSMIGLAGICCLPQSSTAAGKMVSVDKTTNVLLVPNATKFGQANDFANTAKTYIYIDMMVDQDTNDNGSDSNQIGIRGYGVSRTINIASRWIPYDIELKVVENSTGKLVYWLNTVSSRYDSKYFTHTARDVNAKVYFLARTSASPERPVWVQHNVSGTSSFPSSSDTSIYNHMSKLGNKSLSGIGGIVIIPSATTNNGTSTKNFFNPNFFNIGKYSVIYLRISADQSETVNGVHFWQAANIHTTGAQ